MPNCGCVLAFETQRGHGGSSDFNGVGWWRVDPGHGRTTDLNASPASRSGSTARCGSGNSTSVARVPAFRSRPWFIKKSTPSFAVVLAELRRTLWYERISPASDATPLNAQTVKILVEALAVAA